MYGQQKRNIIHTSSTAYEQDHSAAAAPPAVRTSWPAPGPWRTGGNASAKVRRPPPGVVFILNMTDTQAAHAVLEELPLGKAHLMTFQLTPIGPLNPLRQLLVPAVPH